MLIVESSLGKYLTFRARETSGYLYFFIFENLKIFNYFIEKVMDDPLRNTVITEKYDEKIN